MRHGIKLGRSAWLGRSARLGRSAWLARWAGLGACGSLLALAGCGTPGAPLPPSLRLPDPITNLAATRAGDIVTLRWTNPTKTTDKQSISAFQTEMEADLCRSESTASSTPSATPSATSQTSAASADCLPLRKQAVKPGAETTLTDALPASLTDGPPRPLRYWVLLRNRKGRTAGPSNVAFAAAGAAPPAVAGFVASASADGVILRWQPDGTATPIRLHRHVLRGAKPAPGKATSPAQTSILGLPPEPVDEDLIVDAPARTGSAGAVDRQARFDEEYSYTAQRVVTLPAPAAGMAPTTSAASDATSQTAPELAGPMSSVVVVDTTDIFAPAVPRGLGIVFTAATHTMDLSWMPDTEPDLAGYRVDRSEDDGPWQQISPADPVTVPAYSDSTARPGHRYRYAVRAVDTHGNRSKRSAPAEAFATP